MRRQFLACVFLLFSADSVVSDTLHHTISARPATCYGQVFKAPHRASFPLHKIRSIRLRLVQSDPPVVDALPMQLRFSKTESNTPILMDVQCTGSSDWLNCTSAQGDRFMLQQGPAGMLQMMVAHGAVAQMGQPPAPGTAPQPLLFRLSAMQQCS